jgi:GNAT superfamily N-acetyltransferase
MNDSNVRVSYLELTRRPAPIRAHAGDERISRENPSIGEYLDLYGRIGEPLRWDQRFKMPRSELLRLLESERSAIYLLRDSGGQALGLCEFERGVADIELKNFGLLPIARGKGLGPWLLRSALHCEWELQPGRIWLHTDTWDHPAAMHVYESAGFRVYRVREEPPGDL